jgi:formylglycine-generating enzyme required for sulfatase activity
MDTARLLHLLAAGDLTTWPDLARDLERRADADGAAQALGLLHGQGHVVEAAQWLARVTDTPALQALRAATLAQAEGWPLGNLRALTNDLLRGDFRLIPAGSFMMGSPEDEEDRTFYRDGDDEEADEWQHPVEITRLFLFKTTPVTQAEWQAVMGDNPAHFQGDERRPVEQVSWEDAVRFCDALSTRAGGTYHLPTEAQWEYACRSGTTAARYGDLDAIAWHRENSHYSTHPVAQKQPNAWGLYDMLGNVWEWCIDWYHDWYDGYPNEPQRDPTGPLRGDSRVFRGGAWDTYARGCRAARRHSYFPAYRSNGVSFRPTALLG